MPPHFRRIFIANRGEVAVRIARTSDEIGIEPVFGASQADLDAPYLRDREVVSLGPAAASKSYLDVERVVQAAVQTRCSALHPGWGFLAENPLLASLCRDHGVTFIGPTPSVMALMGKKTPAKRAMQRAGLRCIPGSEGPVADVDAARAIAGLVGYPVLLKAESGGGGRGMRIARSEKEISSAYEEAAMEALAAFGDPQLYVEKLIQHGRHVEIQILADRYGNAIHFGERDCTVQRNHQKLIEESPAPVVAREEVEEVSARAVEASRQIGYVGAGTFEFLLDESGKLCFIEMNTRLQVEHPVTEMRCGLDLVAEQIYVAAGRPLPYTQQEIKLDGVAIECRINAEDPHNGFQPSPGLIRNWHVDTDDSIRVETHVESGYTVPSHYDSLLCKVIARAEDRKSAASKLASVLERLVCEGVHTTAPLHVAVLRSKEFLSGKYHAGLIPGWEQT